MAELLRQRGVMQAEARAVGEDLQLHALPGEIREVNRVGSAEQRLMVWRDLDLTVTFRFEGWLGRRAQ